MPLELLQAIAKRSLPCVITEVRELNLLSKLIFAELVVAEFEPDQNGRRHWETARHATVIAITPAGRKALDEMRAPIFRRD